MTKMAHSSTFLYWPEYAADILFHTMAVLPGIDIDFSFLQLWPVWASKTW